MEKVVYSKFGLLFELDKTNLTATIIDSPSPPKHLFLERTIQYQSQDYVITRIGDKSFYKNRSILTIDFSKDSELRSIGKKAFSQTTLNMITIPAKFESFGQDWCLHNECFIKVKLSKDNKTFKYLENSNEQIIVSKLNPNSDTYDNIVFANRDIQEVLIPSTIKQLGNCSFESCRLASMKFEKGSNLEVIQKNAIFEVYKLLKIPASVKELKYGWLCPLAAQRPDVKISPNNTNFKYLDNKIILGKSDPNSDEFDCIIYAESDIEKVVIPPSIKHIYPYAFYQCDELHSVEFMPDSKLISIGTSAFNETNLNSFKIPSSCQRIHKYAFAFNYYGLKSLEIPFDTKIKYIPRYMICNSRVEKLAIPTTVEKLKKGWNEFSYLNEVILSPENCHFSYLDEDHQIIVGKSDLSKDLFNVIVFASKNVSRVVIPSNITHIKSFAFRGCMNMKTVEFAENSQLKTIGEGAFQTTGIKSIDIPSSVTKISSKCFMHTYLNVISIPPKLADIKNLINFELIISDKSKYFKYLDKDKRIIIGKNDIETSTDFDTIFKVSKEIESVFIPSTIKYINDSAFSKCSKLKEVKFEKNSQLKSIGSRAFSSSSIKEMTIPSSVEFIGEYCFANSCIEKIDFEPNSKLTTFEFSLFEKSSIKSITFPQHLNQLNSNWHKDTNIKNIIIPPENKNFMFSNKILLGKTIDNNDFYDTVEFAYEDCDEMVIPSTITIIKDAFVNTKITKIFIPKSVVKICSHAFDNCKYVKSIEIEEDSNLESIGNNALSIPFIKKITLPRKLKSFNSNSLLDSDELKIIEFLSDEITISFEFSENIILLAFPNARKILFIATMTNINKSLVIFTLPYVLIKKNAGDEYE